MSSFICGEKTFNRIYAGLILHAMSEEMVDLVKNDNESVDPFVEAIKRMYGDNVEAYNQRYGKAVEKAISGTMLKKVCRIKEPVSIHQFLKSLECLQYQTNEGSVPATSEMYKAVGNMIPWIYKIIVREGDLYKAAEWG